MTRPRVGFTMGDVNGVGPEILAKAFAGGRVQRQCDPVVYGAVAAYEAARASFAPDAPPARAVDSSERESSRGAVTFIECGAKCPSLRPGEVDADAGACALTWIEAAVKDALARRIHAVVTGPISKIGVYAAGCAYPGHTEMIADLTGCADYRMGLFAGPMRAAHVSAHCSLRDALAALTVERIESTVRIAHEALRRIGIEAPRIAVAGLNPHAGEEGAFGREEIEVVSPAVARCVEAGMCVTGPWPPDTVFRRMAAGDCDLVVALYHDQGHIPLKLIAMDEGVNITLGLPIIRTSVDHGVAYDIAGRGAAREHSLLAAVDLAVKLASAAEVTA